MLWAVLTLPHRARSLLWKIFSLPSLKFGKPQSGKLITSFSLTFFHCLSMAPRPVFVHDSLLSWKCVKFIVTYVRHLQHAPCGSARLSCGATPTSCQGMVLAHSWCGLCPLSLPSVAWLISTSLPKFPQLKEKIKEWQCETKLWFYPNYRVASWNNNARGTAWIAGVLVKGFTGISIENSPSCSSDFSFILFCKR